MIVPDSSRVLVLMLEHKCTSLVGTLKLFKCRPDYWDHYTHLSTYQSRKHQRYTNITRDTHSQLPFVPLSQSAPSHRFTPPEIHHSLTHNTHTATSHNTPPDQTSKVTRKQTLKLLPTAIPLVIISVVRRTCMSFFYCTP
jgi:hypothetical protein